MDRYSENQYDDLTLGGDYDNSYFSDSDDLFDFNPAGDSPLNQLKSLVLSIDWEITDDVLLMFNEELLILRDLWAGEKINLVYIQALEKISKYIYARKADAHPSAIKFLLTLYHNLEKIVSYEDMTVEQKKAILREDVKAFEQLKVYINRDLAAARPDLVSAREKALKDSFAPPGKEEPAAVVPELSTDKKEREPLSLNVSGGGRGAADALMRLKAILFDLDREITDGHLTNLKFEVADLKEQFRENESCLDLLSGIGEAGEYLQKKKSEVYSEGLKVLRLLFEGLEHIVSVTMNPEEERTSVFPLLEKLQAFRMLMENNVQVSDDLPADGSVAFLSGREEDVSDNPAEITSALASSGEEEEHGFWAEEEMAGVDTDSDAVNLKIGGLFSEESEVAPDSVSIPKISEELALQGVDVETDDDDDSGEDTLPLDGDQLAPALATSDESEDKEIASVLVGEDDEEESVAALSVQEDEPAPALSFEEKETPDFSATGEKQVTPALEDTTVEIDDDDDLKEGVSGTPAEMTPALASSGEEEEHGFWAEEEMAGVDTDSDAVNLKIGGLFSEESEVAPDSVNIPKISEELALQGVDVETDDDDDSGEDT
ncbi:hypothetical protein JWG39_11930, partial [Desulforhopalus vacuolatus]|uniref:hypothetical protein n=1 Tax=Desulforhopalus vacuolatus TaxID=40414 RepID=UPI0019650CCC